jgi:hypothetical protein
MGEVVIVLSQYLVDPFECLTMKDLAMTDADTERHIGETMAEVLRERLVELETLEATGTTEDTVVRLAFVRMLLVRFDARDTAQPQTGE